MNIIKRIGRGLSASVTEFVMGLLCFNMAYYEPDHLILWSALAVVSWLIALIEFVLGFTK